MKCSLQPREVKCKALAMYASVHTCLLKRCQSWPGDAALAPPALARCSARSTRRLQQRLWSRLWTPPSTSESLAVGSFSRRRAGFLESASRRGGPRVCSGLGGGAPYKSYVVFKLSPKHYKNLYMRLLETVNQEAFA